MFSGRKQQPLNANNTPASEWFRKPRGADASAAVIAASHDLSFSQIGIQTRNFRNATLYGGYGYFSGSRFSASVIPPSGPLSAVSASQGRLGPHYNVINSVINTILSRILANGAPHVTFLTNDGDWKLQHRAQLLDQFCEGLMYQVGLLNTATRVLLDCLVFGTGILKVSSDANDNIRADRVFPNEIWAEAWDSREQRPRTLYQVGTEDRDVLAAQYPAQKQAIMALKPMHPLDQSTAAGYNTNVVAVWEAWHLPSPGAKDGRYIKTLGKDITLVDEKWEEDSFPFVFIRFSDVLTGFHGLGVAELLWGHQGALNVVTRAEYMAHSQFSMPKWYVDLNTKLNENHLLSSRSGLVLKGQGPPPIPLNANATTENFVQWKEWIISSAYEFVGVSQMAATGVKPQGLNSGAAIRDYMDTGDVRFTVLSQRFGQFYVDAAERLVAEARRIYSKTGEMSSKVLGKSFIKEINWKDIDLEQDEYRLKLYETSSLPRTPAGKLSFVQELLQANMLTPAEGRKLLQFPDLDETMSLENAAEDNAELTAYKLLYTDEPVVPDPLQDVATCIKVVTQSALKAIDQNAPREKVDRCRTWLVNAKALVAPPAPPMAPPGAPQAKPAPPPVSNMLPNQPVQAAA